MIFHPLPVTASESISGCDTIYIKIFDPHTLNKDGAVTNFQESMSMLISVHTVTTPTIIPTDRRIRITDLSCLNLEVSFLLPY